MRRILVTIIALIGLAAMGFSQIKDSSDWLVGRSEHSLLHRLRSNLGFDDTPVTDGDAVAVVTIEGVKAVVLVVGPVKGDAKKYAQAIEDWRTESKLPGVVEYSQEDDCASARYELSTGGFGKMSASLDLPLRSLYERLKPLESKTSMALMVPGYTSIDLTEKETYIAPAGNRYWEFTKSLGPERVHTAIKIPGWVPPAVVAWLTLPLVGFGLCFGLGFTYARRQDIPIEKRRRFYSMLVSKGIFVVLGIHAVLVIVTIPTRALDPVSQLWVGQRFSQFAILVVPLFAIVPIALLPLLNKMETKLLGPTEAEKADREDFSEYQRPPMNTDAAKSDLKKNLWSSGIVLVALAIFLFIPAHKGSLLSNLQSVIVPIYLILTLLVRVIVRTIKSKKGGVDPIVAAQEAGFEQYRPRVEARLAAVATKLGEPVPTVSVMPLLQGPYGACISNHRLMVTPALADRFTDGELDFILAHELAHKNKGHLKTRLFIFLIPAVLIFIVMFRLALGMSSSVWLARGFVFSPMLLILVFYVFGRPLLMKYFRKNEYQADEVAVRATGDREAAISALAKIARQNGLAGYDEDEFLRTHPLIANRIERIRTLAL